jgi:hypothetical protein
MAGNPIDKIRGMLASNAPERQIAAAIVLGEIGAHDAATCDALARAVDGGIPPVARHALEALARLASGGTARKLVPRVLAALASRDEAVRRAAAEAAIAFAAGGSADSTVAAVRARLAEATDPTERRGLEEVLGRVGGKDAFAALLTALDTSDAEASRVAALAVRQRLKEASAREKASYLAQVTKLLSTNSEPADGFRTSRDALGRGKPVLPRRESPATGKTRGKPGPSHALLAGALKILGYLEDPAAIPTLLAFARDKRQEAAVREAAIVALRFTARGKAGAKVPAALVELAEQAAPELARAALYSLATLELPTALVGRLRKLAVRGEPERALLAIERLAQIAGAAAADALAAVLTDTEDRALAEAAATALAGRPDGAFALGRALPETRDPERAALLARLLRPHARVVAEGGAAGKTLTRALVADAVARVGRGGPGADATLALARDLDRAAVGAGLRALAAKAQKKDPAAALALLRMVGHAADATVEDGYALAAAELRAGRRDEALGIVAQLTDRGFDLASAFRRDRTLTPEHRYQLGFALVERRHPAGEEVLTDLAASGRSKLATMARAKLKSAGFV